MVPYFFRAEWAVEQEHSAFDQRLEHVVALEENPLMACDEVCFRHQVSGANWVGSEAEVRNRHRSRLLRIVNKISLRVVGCVLTNDLDGILVGTDGAVRAEAVEHRAYNALRLNRKFWIVFQAGVIYVIVNSNCEVVLLRAGSNVVEYSLHHRWRKF